MDVFQRQQKCDLCLEFAKLMINQNTHVIHDLDFHDLQEKLSITKQPQFITWQMDVLPRQLQRKRGLCLEFAKLINQNTYVIHDLHFHDFQEKLVITKQPQFITWQMDVFLRQQKRGLCLEFAKLIHDPDFHDLQEKLTITKQPQFPFARIADSLNQSRI
jgi:hypothetical protein